MFDLPTVAQRSQMGVPASPAPVLNVSPAAAAAEQQRNPPRSFDVVWSLNHVDDVGEPCTLCDREAPAESSFATSVQHTRATHMAGLQMSNAEFVLRKGGQLSSV